jgi:glycosyltransferase involved in cell wall biosynthesis
MKQLRSEIKTAQPELIHANSIRAGLVATTASVGTNIPVIWILQDALPLHPISTAIRIFVIFSKRTRLMPASQATLDRFRGKLLKTFGKNIPEKVIHNAIELEKFSLDSRNRKLIRDELHLSDDEFVLGIVGQITPRKGQLELIENFAKVQSQIPTSTLLIVGAPMFNKDHIYLEELKNAMGELGIEDRVKFLGLRKDVAAIMQSIDLLVINSKSEALVIVAIEAMACRTPIIATDVGGTTEIIEHKKNGWIVPFGDEKALIEAIGTLANDAELRKKFADESEKIVTSHLSAERLMREVEEFYEQCALEEKKAVNSDLAIES